MRALKFVVGVIVAVGLCRDARAEMILYDIKLRTITHSGGDTLRNNAEGKLVLDVAIDPTTRRVVRVDEAWLVRACEIKSPGRPVERIVEAVDVTASTGLHVVMGGKRVFMGAQVGGLTTIGVIPTRGVTIKKVPGATFSIARSLTGDSTVVDPQSGSIDEIRFRLRLDPDATRNALLDESATTRGIAQFWFELYVREGFVVGPDSDL